MTNRQRLDAWRKRLVIAAVVIGLAVWAVLDLLPRQDNSVPDHWTQAYAEQTYRDFNRGALRGRYEKSCVLDQMETAFPNPRDAERAVKHGNRVELETVAEQIQQNC
jgi:hypothetical protein